MTAEEFIEMVRADAAEFAPDDAARFVQAAWEELIDSRAPTDERTERQTIPRRPRPPARYRDQFELWLVFSVFVAHFVHPVGAALEVAEFASELEDPAVSRFIFAAEGDTARRSEIRTENRDELARDYAILVQLAQELGTEAFGGEFNIDDFLEPEVVFPKPDEEDRGRGSEPERDR